MESELRICVLRTEDKGEYGPKIITMFQELFKQVEEETSTIVTLVDYDVKQESYPENYEEFDGVLIPGSASSAYDDDSWIQTLKRVIQDLWSQQKRVVGVCFGHQIVAQALGGRVESNPAGCQYSVRSFVPTPLCEQILAVPVSEVSLLYHHNDIVIQEPDGVTSLGSNDSCPSHGFFSPERVFTVQGHPEFSTPEGMRVLMAIINQDKEKNKIPEEEITTECNAAQSLMTNATDFAQAFIRFWKGPEN